MSDEREEGAGRGFKVVDRRRFTTDGDLREGVDETPAKEAPAAKAPVAEAAPAVDDVPPAEAAAPAAQEAAEAAEQQQEQTQEELLFMAFLKSLATQAMMQLGMMPHPATGRPELHLEGAQETIEILTMLQAKTKGNLNSEENQMLSSVLYELGDAYRQIMQQLAAQAMQDGPGGPGGPGGPLG